MIAILKIRTILITGRCRGGYEGSAGMEARGTPGGMGVALRVHLSLKEFLGVFLNLRGRYSKDSLEICF